MAVSKIPYPLYRATPRAVFWRWHAVPEKHDLFPGNGIADGRLIFFRRIFLFAERNHHFFNRSVPFGFRHDFRVVLQRHMNDAPIMGIHCRHRHRLPPAFDLFGRIDRLLPELVLVIAFAAFAAFAAPGTTFPALSYNVM